MCPRESEPSLFDRVGRVPGVTRLIGRFYANVLNDPSLRPYFAGVELRKLQRMQFEFFSAALGGPTAYGGRSMQHAHQGRHITREHFQAFVEHLFETLQECDLTDEDRYAIIARINTYADDVFDTGSAPSE
jgi:hemoglobin